MRSHEREANLTRRRQCFSASKKTAGVRAPMRNDASTWRRQASAKKTLKLHTPVSSLLQVRPSLSFYGGIRVEGDYEAVGMWD
jgi:hypothetical protein